MTPPDSGDAKNTNDDDPLGGMDPMAWLESLARRQGANPDELTTAANIDIPTPPADTQITGPGYTPGYDTGKMQPVKASVEPSKPVPQENVQPAQPVPTLPAAPIAQPVAAADDPFGGMDMMAWMESLARRQGANPDELTTAANLDIPTPSADTAITGPGYTPGYDTGKMQPVKAVAEVKPEPTPAVEPEPTSIINAPPVVSTTSELSSVSETVAATAAADDPLGGMDPMAWLESLARRQGANPDELTTAADLDVAIPSADTAITGPGYTPGYETSKTTPVKPIEGTKVPSVAASVMPAEAQPVAPSEPEPVGPVASTLPAAADDPLGGMDMMAWMESLARRQGANPNELTTAANLDIPTPPPGRVIDEPGYVEYDPFSVSSRPRTSETNVTSTTPAAPLPVAPSLTPSPTAEPVASAATSDDPLGGMDPLAWLESLAVRQDADTSELVTGGTLNLPYAVNEPETGKPTEPAVSQSVMSADEANQVLGIRASGEMQPTLDATASMDPMAWLESLSQGQDNTDFTTFDFAEMPAQTADDYSMFEAMTAPTEASMAPESALSWLEQLTQGQGDSSTIADETTFEDQASEQIAEPTLETELEVLPLEAGGLSNDISEVQRWLDQQAQSLELTRVAQEDQESDQLTPAEPGQLPDWLVNSLADAASTAPVLSNEITPPPTPADLPPWLTESEAEPADISYYTDFFQLTPDENEVAPLESASVGLTSDELAAITQPSSPDQIDSWAEALDEEYDRRQAGDESVPTWYMEALSRVETEPTPELPTPVPTISDIQRPTASEGYDDFELPDWLRETPEEPAAAVAGTVPDWLLEMSRADSAIPSGDAPDLTIAEPTAVAGDDMDWLNDVNLTPAVIPDWLKPAQATSVEAEPLQAAAPTPAEAVKPVEAVEPIATTPAPVVEVPKTPEPPKVEPTPVRVVAAAPVPVMVNTIPAATIDHQARLQQARQLVASAQVADSLEHYQTLIDSSQLLEETRGDLRQLVDQNPKEPKLRRLLGDTHMRLGDLQAALDTYRSALDQL